MYLSIGALRLTSLRSKASIALPALAMIVFTMSRSPGVIISHLPSGAIALALGAPLIGNRAASAALMSSAGSSGVGNMLLYWVRYFAYSMWAYSRRFPAKLTALSQPLAPWYHRVSSLPPQLFHW